MAISKFHLNKDLYADHLIYFCIKCALWPRLLYYCVSLVKVWRMKTHTSQNSTATIGPAVFYGGSYF